MYIASVSSAIAYMVALKMPTQKTIQSTTAHSAAANVCDIALMG